MKFKYFLIITLLKIVFLQTKNEILDEALKYGYDLTDPEDNFFHDICLRFDYIKKDLTLEYRRNFYFFPENKKEIVTFQRPKRNNIKDCFSKSETASTFFLNYSFYVFLPLILVQVLLILLSFLMRYKDSIKHSPYLKLKIQKKIGNENDLDNRNNNNVGGINKKLDFYQLNQEIDESNNAISQSVNEAKENLQTNQLPDTNDTNNCFVPKSNSGDYLGNDNKKKEDNQEPSPAVEKSTENYTFGVNFGKGYQFSSDNSINNNENKNENKNEKIEDKMKRIQYVYEQMNQQKIINKQNKSKKKS